ncbi:hypothetical protein AAE478_007734 [Parahypoxylon ruwenzoriense]
MGLTHYLACFASLATTTISAWNDFTDLHPILAPSYDVAKLENIVPSAVVSLDYSLDPYIDPRSSVSINLHADQPAVLLEAIEAVHDVVCTPSTVSVIFSAADAFQRTILEWPRDGNFYLITNHPGNCNARGERGIYQVASLSWDNDAAVVTARTEETNFGSIATSMGVSFSHAHGTMLNNTGNITFDEPGINVASNFSIPQDMGLFSAPPYFSATADGGYLSDAAFIRGYFFYDVPSENIQSLWFDIDAALFADLAVTFNLTGASNSNEYTFSPGTFFPSAITVPSAFNLKPALRWAIGADVGAEGVVSHSTNITVTIPDGRVHLDFINENRTSIVGWGPRLTSSFNTREAATAHTSPYVDFSIELALDVLDGAFNVTGGVTARPQLVNELSVAQNQRVIRKANHMNWLRNVTCSSGYELRSAFNFSVAAFVTDRWEKTLYNTNIPITDECYHF